MAMSSKTFPRVDTELFGVPMRMPLPLVVRLMMALLAMRMRRIVQLFVDGGSRSIAMPIELPRGSITTLRSIV